MALKPLLFTRFSALGDVASALRVVDAAAQRWPQRPLAFVTHQRFLPLVDLLRVDCRALGYGKPESELSDFWALRRWIDTEMPVVVDLHSSPRTRVLRWMGDGKDWRVLRKKRLKRRALCNGDATALPEDERVQSNQAALLDLELPGDRPWLQHDEPIAGDVLLVPGAAWELKRWPLRHFHALGQSLVEAGRGVQVLASTGDGLDLQSLDWGPVELLVDLPLDQCLARLAGAQAVVSNDTGFAHVAEGMGRPTLVLIGPTDQRMGAAPQSDNPWAKPLRLGLDCQPCSQKGDRPCRVPGRPCLETLSVDQVLEALAPLIDGRVSFGHKRRHEGKRL